MDCKNCKNTLRDVDGFCSSCGARIIDERISLRFLFKEFLDKVLSVDNKLLKTFFHLFTKPEVVIDGFIKGVRKKYYNPLNYLLVSITLSGIYLYFLKDIALESIGVNPVSGAENTYGNIEFVKDIFNFTSEYQALIIVAFIPVYGFISWLLFLNKKKYNFYEHLIIYLYTTSQATVVSFLVVVPISFIDKGLFGITDLVMTGATLLYFGYVLIRLFKLTFFQVIIKTIYFLFISGFLFILLMISIIIGVFLFSSPGYLKQLNPQNIDSIEKTKQLDSVQMIQKNDSIKKLILD